jgi:hypothetical protein
MSIGDSDATGVLLVVFLTPVGDAYAAELFAAALCLAFRVRCSLSANTDLVFLRPEKAINLKWD